MRNTPTLCDQNSQKKVEPFTIFGCGGTFYYLSDTWNDQPKIA